MKKKGIIISLTYIIVILKIIYLTPISLTFSVTLQDSSGISHLPINLEFYWKRYLDGEVYNGTIIFSNQSLSLRGVETSEIVHLYSWVKFHYIIDNEYKPEDTINLYFKTQEGYDGYIFIYSKFHDINLIIKDPISENVIRYTGKITDIDLAKN